MQSFVLNSLQFLDIGVWYERVSYGVYILHITYPNDCFKCRDN